MKTHSKHQSVLSRWTRMASLALLTPILIAHSSAAFAANQGADYPSKPVRIIVGFPAGGAADILARLLSEKLGSAYKQSFVVENKSGAGGTIGAGIASRSAGDGYTLLLGVTASQTIAPSIYKDLNYDPNKDFEPIAMIATIPVALVVNSSVKANTAAELVSLAKSVEPPLAYASSGVGAIPHLTGALFQKSQALDLLHVPFKGSSPALTEVLAGRVQIMFDHLPSSLPAIKTGRLRALGIAGDKRAAALPNVPTMAEAGMPDVAVASWFGLLAPAGTPGAIVTKLNELVNEQLDTPEAREAIAALGAEVSTTTPQEFADIIRADSKKWADIVRLTGANAN